MNYDLISRTAAFDILDAYQVMVENGEGNPYAWARLRMSELPPAQPELIEKAAYIRGFEHGRTQGMIDRKAEEVAQSDLQPTCNQLATDAISRQEALNIRFSDAIKEDGVLYVPLWDFIDGLKSLPSAQTEPAIPLQWIEAHIEWLKSLDNAFSTLTAVQISAMVNKWKEGMKG